MHPKKTSTPKRVNKQFLSKLLKSIHCIILKTIIIISPETILKLSTRDFSIDIYHQIRGENNAMVVYKIYKGGEGMAIQVNMH